MPEFLEFGVLGIVAVALSTYIYRIDKFHRAERNLWRKQAEAQFKLMANVTDKNTEVLSGLRELIKSINGRIK